MSVLDVFSTPGSFVWTFPAGVYSVTVECLGGGGGGESKGILTGGGDGGGGGGYGKRVYSGSPGGTLNYHVGAGGAANADGADSWVNTSSDTVGRGGKTGNGTNAGGTGVGTTTHTGGKGGNGGGTLAGAGGGGGSSAGTAANGANGTNGSSTVAGTGGTAPSGGGDGGNGNTATNNGLPGVAPGGGGGGAGTNATGGAGGNGQATFTYEPPTTAPVPAISVTTSVTAPTISTSSVSIAVSVFAVVVLAISPAMTGSKVETVPVALVSATAHMVAVSPNIVLEMAVAPLTGIVVGPVISGGPLTVPVPAINVGTAVVPPAANYLRWFDSHWLGCWFQSRWLSVDTCTQVFGFVPPAINFVVEVVPPAVNHVPSTLPVPAINVGTAVVPPAATMSARTVSVLTVTVRVIAPHVIGGGSLPVPLVFCVAAQSVIPRIEAETYVVQRFCAETHVVPRFCAEVHLAACAPDTFPAPSRTIFAESGVGILLTEDGSLILSEM